MLPVLCTLLDSKSLRPSINLSLGIAKQVYQLHEKGMAHLNIQGETILVEPWSLDVFLDNEGMKNARRIGSPIPEEFIISSSDRDVYAQIPPEYYDERDKEGHVASAEADLWALGYLFHFTIPVEHMPMYDGKLLTDALRAEDPSQRPPLSKVIELLEMIQFACSKN